MSFPAFPASTIPEPVIEVVRSRWMPVGIAVRYHVIIDDVVLGAVGRGRPTKFPISPGTHTVRIRAVGGSESNELTLTLLPDTVRLLRCKANPAVWSVIAGGIFRLPQQIELLGKMRREGRSSVKGLLLVEVQG